MPAVSKAQQRFMGMVHAADKGETPASPEVAKVSKNMKDSDAKDFASTKHDGLPDHVKEQLKSVVREVIREKNGISEMSHNDVHFKNILKLYDRGGSFTKKKVGSVVCKDPKASRNDIIDVLEDSDYKEIIELEDELGLQEIREKYSSVNEEFKHVIHVDTPTQVVSKPVAAQIMALAKKGVRANEIGLEMGFVGNQKVATDAFQKVKNQIYFALDKRNESVSEGSHGMATKLLQSIVNGDSSRAEGTKMSKELAQHYIDWIRTSPFGKKNSNLPLDMLVKASFNWGIERGLDSKLKGELSKLKSTIKESINESLIAKDGKILLNGKPVGYYDYDRDSAAFWTTDLSDKQFRGSKAFDTKEEMLAFFKKYLSKAAKALEYQRKALSKFGIKYPADESVNEAAFKSPDYIVTSIPASAIPQTNISKADVGLGLAMGDEFGMYSTLNNKHYKLDYHNGKVALVLSKVGKLAVRVRSEKDSKYLAKIEKFVNDYLTKFAKNIKKTESVNEVKYPTDLKVGSVILGQGFTMLKGIEGGKYYKVVSMDDTTATLTPSDKSGNTKGSSKVRHKLDSIEGGIKTAKRGDENGIVVIKESVNEEHDCGCNENHDCGCGGLHEHHINEDINADANGIAGLTASRANAVKDFIEKNNINSNKLYLSLKKGGLKDRMDFVTALVGKPGNPIQKKVIAQFSN